MVSDRRVLPYKSVVLTNHPAYGNIQSNGNSERISLSGERSTEQERGEFRSWSGIGSARDITCRFQVQWRRPRRLVEAKRRHAKTTTNIPSYVRFLPPGENPLHVTTLPAGTCSYCCPIDVDQDIEYLLFTRCVGN